MKRKENKNFSKKLYLSVFSVEKRKENRYNTFCSELCRMEKKSLCLIFFNRIFSGIVLAETMSAYKGKKFEGWKG